MKKKFFVACCALTALCFSAISTFSCDTIDQTGNIQLGDGVEEKIKSVYELFLEQNPEGTPNYLTYEEWLESLKGDTGETGAAGEKGDKGDKGDRGDAPYLGENGNWWIGTEDLGIAYEAKGVQTITLINTVENVDTYEILFTDGSTSHFTVTNGKDGAQGIQGEKGENGHTPFIHIDVETGCWVVDGVLTGCPSRGATGEKGDKGDAGEDGEDGLSPYIGENNNWWLGDEDLGISALGIKGDKGDAGEAPYIDEFTGNWFVGGVDSGVSAKGTDGSSVEIIGGYWYVDGINTTVPAKGEDGTDGLNGLDGYTPYIGENGNWFINGVDTGHSAKGIDGTNGETPSIIDGYWYIGETPTGKKAEGTDGVTPHIGENHHWYIGDTDTMICADGLKGDKGDQGEQGEKGDKGDQGEQGEKGDKGDTGATGEKGDQGEKGDKGDAGVDGTNGLTPSIGANGNWYIGDVDTGHPSTGATGATGATGEKGDKGDKGDTGETGAAGTNGTNGTDGKDGKDGVSITGLSIIRTEDNGITDVYQVTYSDGTTSEYKLVNYSRCSHTFFVTDTDVRTYHNGEEWKGYEETCDICGHKEYHFTEIVPALFTFSGGNGTAADPFLISDADEFMQLHIFNSDYAAKNYHFKLTDDIDISLRNTDDFGYFYGNIDGDGHTIDFSSVTTGTLDKWNGVFETYIGTLENVTLNYTVGTTEVEPFIYTAQDTLFDNVTLKANKTLEASVMSNNDSIFLNNCGGNTTFKNITNEVNVNSSSYTSAILGGYPLPSVSGGDETYFGKTSFINCVNKGNLTGSYTGFLIGNGNLMDKYAATPEIAAKHIYIEGCENQGTITGANGANLFAAPVSGAKGLAVLEEMYATKNACVNGENGICELNGVDISNVTLTAVNHQYQISNLSDAASYYIVSLGVVTHLGTSYDDEFTHGEWFRELQSGPIAAAEGTFDTGLYNYRIIKGKLYPLYDILNDDGVLDQTWYIKLDSLIVTEYFLGSEVGGYDEDGNELDGWLGLPPDHGIFPNVYLTAFDSNNNVIGRRMMAKGILAPEYPKGGETNIAGVPSAGITEGSGEGDIPGWLD